MRHQASEKIGPWINEAIDRHWDGSPVLWEAGLAPNKGSAALCCVFWIPGTTLGTVQQGSFLIHNPLGATKADIDKTVADFLAHMRAAQAEDLAETPVAAPSPQETLQRGQRRSSGLFVG